jgi:hypothetical protein
MLQKKQAGYFLVVAVIFIVSLGALGILMTTPAGNRSNTSVNALQGLKAFYNAGSGLEIITRLLSMGTLTGSPARLTCAQVNGNASTTNASLNGGTFTVTTPSGGPTYASTSLSSAAGLTDTTINLTSTAGLSAQGRVMIDREAIDYLALSGNTLINVTRGAANTVASAHLNGITVTQYQCAVQSEAGIPSVASPTYLKTLQTAVQLEDGWAVGNSNGNNYTLQNWNRLTAGAWTSQALASGGTSSNANMMAVDFLANGEGWAMGTASTSGAFVTAHYQGSSWTKNLISGACTTQNLLGVSLVSTQEGYAVGTNYASNGGCGTGGTQRYTIMKGNGTTWSLLTPSTTPSIPADSASNQTLNAVKVIDTNGDGVGDFGFAVGNNGTILQYNGSSWVRSSSGTTNNLFGVTVGPGYAFAAGAAGTLLEWSGSSWAAIGSDLTGQINDVKVIGVGTAWPNFGVTVTNNGYVTVTLNGNVTIAQPVTTSLNAIAIINTNDVWVVGNGGVTLHWDGSSWTNFTSNTSINLNGVAMIGPSQQAESGWRQVFN